MLKHQRESIKKTRFSNMRINFNERSEIVWRNRLEHCDRKLFFEDLIKTFDQRTSDQKTYFISESQALRLVRYVYSNIRYFNVSKYSVDIYEMCKRFLSQTDNELINYYTIKIGKEFNLTCRKRKLDDMSKE